jgi:hypothetical protein
MRYVAAVGLEAVARGLGIEQDDPFTQEALTILELRSMPSEEGFPLAGYA